MYSRLREPVLHVTARWVDRAQGTMHVTVRKSWWGGPTVGGATRVLVETDVDVHVDDDVNNVRQVLRALADSL